MKQPINSQHVLDVNGMPAGGETTAKGIWIAWQSGPLNRGQERLDPNGAFVETVIACAIDRLEFYQATKFNCVENALAIKSLENALQELNNRTADRERREVEGTHEI